MSKAITLLEVNNRKFRVARQSNLLLHAKAIGLLATLSFQNGKLDQALRASEEVVRSCQTSFPPAHNEIFANCLYINASVLAKRRHYTSALELFEQAELEHGRASLFDPLMASIKLGRAEILTAVGQKAEARSVALEVMNSLPPAVKKTKTADRARALLVN